MFSERSPFVSIIIPAFNEAKYISGCLNSLKNLNYPKERYEIIVVDNGSTDETVSISRSFTDKVYLIPGVNVSSLRNFGAQKGNGEIYAFIDADCLADAQWIRNAVSFLEGQGCITGSKCQVPLNSGWVEKTWFSQRENEVTEVPYINSGNLIVPANIFKSINGFNESLVTGEDYEFCLRAKRITKVISNDNIRVIHLGNPKTLRQFLKREMWHGLG